MEGLEIEEITDPCVGVDGVVNAFHTVAGTQQRESNASPAGDNFWVWIASRNRKELEEYRAGVAKPAESETFEPFRLGEEDNRQNG